jgi:hypothetical protein
MIIALQ